MRTTSSPLRLVAALAAALLVLVVAPVAADERAAAAPGDQPRLLETPANGQAAIRALGDRLPAAAALNDRTPAQLRELLAEDSAVWIDEHGRMLYRDTGLRGDHAAEDHADEAGDPHGDGDVLEGYDPSTAFQLSTMPGADRTIYLDFDGHDASGTAWDEDGTGYVASAYDSDGDPTTFSDDERSVIHEVWARVAEDFAPFAVNVTTADPGHDALVRDSSSDRTYGSRLVVSSTSEPLCSCGGVAYVGVFDLAGYGDHYQPAWVFTSGVGTGAENIAEAGSHEVGHNLGLSHDGASTTNYYRGHNGWAPIMGVGYYEPITQWSAGEYVGADNAEDDLSVMVGQGAPLLADDHADTLLVAATSSTAGMIHHRDDTDTFAFDAAAGPATILAEAADHGANLDIALSLRDANGNLLATADPTSTALSDELAAGMAAALTVDLPADGRYEVTIDGTGRGSVDDGYSDYASLGRYELHVTAATGDSGGPTNSAPTAAATGPSSAETGQQLTFDSSGSSDPDGDTLTHDWSFSDGTTASGPEVTHAFTTAGTHTATVTVTDPAGASDTARVTVEVTEPATPAPGTPTNVAASVDSTGTVTVMWNAASNADSYTVSRQVLHRNGRWKDDGTVGSTTGTSITDAPVAGTYRYRVTATNGAGSADSTWSAPVEVTSSGGTDDGGGGGGGGSDKPGNGNGGGPKWK